MSKNTTTGKFEPETGGDYNGSYVDFVYSDAQKEAIAAGKGTHFFDPTIIPTVQYQVYGLDNVWFWDNEGQNYSYNGGASSISIKVIESITITKTYYGSNKNVASSLTDVQKAGATKINSTSDIPGDAAEGTYYYIESETPTYADGTTTTPYEFNKYGKEPNGKLVEVTITPNSTLANNYPGAIVTVNGKEHDLNYLASITSSTSGNPPVTTYTVGAPKPIILVMDKDYRISINWVWGQVVETFRIICNR